MLTTGQQNDEFHILWDSRQIFFLNCLGPAIELEKGKPESIEPEPEVQKTYSEEANTSTYYPAPVPVMDKYILENGKVFNKLNALLQLDTK